MLAKIVKRCLLILFVLSNHVCIDPVWCQTMFFDPICIVSNHVCIDPVWCQTMSFDHICIVSDHVF